MKTKKMQKRMVWQEDRTKMHILLPNHPFLHPHLTHDVILLTFRRLDDEVFQGRVEYVVLLRVKHLSNLIKYFLPQYH